MLWGAWQKMQMRLSGVGLLLLAVFVAGLLMFVALYGFALWATWRDPEMLRILLASSKLRNRYDPGKHTRVELEVVPC